MGIRGLWHAITGSGKIFDPSMGQYNPVIIDATMITINICVPVSHLNDEQFEEVVRRNFKARVDALVGTFGDIVLVFVFDPAKRPDTKIRPRPIGTLDDLRVRSFGLIHELIIEFGHRTVESLEGVEADHTMANLYDYCVKDNLNPIIYSEDSDMLYLVPNVSRFDFTIYNRDTVLAFLGIDLETFLAACKAAANDYNDSSMTFSRSLAKIISTENNEEK